MSMRVFFKRIPALLAAAALLVSFAGCEDRANPYISRPQDSMVLYEKEGGVYLTNTDAAAYTAEGSKAGSINMDTVPLASGSAYYVEDGVLYFKSYLEPAYKMTEDVESLFYSIGSVFAVTRDGKLLRTDDSNRYEEVLSGLSLTGPAPVVECGNTVYAAADHTLYRLFFGGAPEKMQTFEGDVTFLSGNSDEVFFAADGAVWKCGHKAVSPKKISGRSSVTPIVPELPVSYAEKLFWTDDEGLLTVYETASGKSSATQLRLASPEAKLLPEGASNAEALVLKDESGFHAYFFESGETVALEEAAWVYAEKDTLYGFREGSLLIYKAGEISCADGFEMTHVLFTPDGYYFLTGPEEGYQAILWSLHDGEAEKIAENVWGSHAPRAVYKYGGISYFTDKAIYIMDEESRVSEEFAACENVTGFVPRSGGAYTLFADGRLDVMIYGETQSQTVAEGVTRIFESLYMPERLTTYPVVY